jgi:hypothetical protein
MHDAGLLGMRETREQPVEDAGGLRVAHPPDVRAQRSALQVLHRDHRSAVPFKEVVHRDDVRMAERRGHARLAHKPPRVRRIRRVKRQQLLQRDKAAKIGLASEMHDRHPAAPELAHNLIPADNPDVARAQPGRSPGSMAMTQYPASPAGRQRRPPRLQR